MPRAFRSEALTINLIVRNISSTCNSSGSGIWASAKNIKPLIDANCHTEAIEFAYHQSPIRFPPIHYQHPGSDSLSPSSGRTILFGSPLELHTVGEVKKIPPVLEYLLDSVYDWPGYEKLFTVGQKHVHCTSSSLYSKMGAYLPLMNGLEQAWTGVEDADRAIISKIAPQPRDRASLIMVCRLRCTVQNLSDFVGILYGPSKASMDRP